MSLSDRQQPIQRIGDALQEAQAARLLRAFSEVLQVRVNLEGCRDLPDTFVSVREESIRRLASALGELEQYGQIIEHARQRQERLAETQRQREHEALLRQRRRSVR